MSLIVYGVIIVGVKEKMVTLSQYFIAKSHDCNDTKLKQKYVGNVA